MIVGGLLTALGSFVLQRTSRAAERREFLRARLEQMYTLTSQVQRWANQQVSVGASVGLAASPGGGLAGAAAEVMKGANERQSTDEIVMLARFYHPRLAPQAELLDQLATSVVTEVNNFVDYIASKPFDAEPDARRLERAAEARDTLRGSAEQFKKSLSDEVRAFI